jgi:hypothetical protein
VNQSPAAAGKAIQVSKMAGFRGWYFACAKGGSCPSVLFLSCRPCHILRSELRHPLQHVQDVFNSSRYIPVVFLQHNVRELLRLARHVRQQRDSPRNRILALQLVLNRQHLLRRRRRLPLERLLRWQLWPLPWSMHRLVRRRVSRYMSRLKFRVARANILPRKPIPVQWPGSGRDMVVR